MRKFLAISILFLASVLAFGQDGRTKINFYNNTDVTLRFLLNGQPACTGDVIPNGTCTEILNAGDSYAAGASDGNRSVQGETFVAEYGHTYEYRVSVQESQYRVPAGLRLASLKSYGAFSVDSPVTLVDNGTENATTTSGASYTRQSLSAEVQNGDVYMVSVATYPFNLPTDNFDTFINGFTGTISGTISKSFEGTASGNPARMYFIDGLVGGQKAKFVIEVVLKGNKAYIFAFGTLADATGTDTEAVKTFFQSISIQ